MLGGLSTPCQSLRFTSWHVVDVSLHDDGRRELNALVHFRLAERFTEPQLLRGSIYGSYTLRKDWIAAGGFFSQRLKGDGEWTPQQRFFYSISRPFSTPRLLHTPRFQVDHIFGTPAPAYTRYRFGFQTEYRARVRPYAGIEEFVEPAGHQRSRYRAGVRFAGSPRVDVDLQYAFDRIFLRNPANRHILQTTFSFHRRSDKISKR